MLDAKLTTGIVSVRYRTSSAPIGAEVRLSIAGDRGFRNGYILRNGAPFRFPLRPGTYQLTAGGQNYAGTPVTKEVQVGVGEIHVEFSGSAGAVTLSLELQFDTGVEGAVTLVISGAEGQKITAVRHARMGRVTFQTHLRPGKYRVGIEGARVSKDLVVPDGKAGSHVTQRIDFR